MATPTKAQLDYAKDLMEKLGYDEQDLEINLDRMDRMEMAQLIGELKREYEG
ncbi:MAG: hypothetical protein IJ741_07020 [Schwartzia sp.]|nr:hypothetical protein [Schwartzia sp. (in: firmicutes)]